MRMVSRFLAFLAALAAAGCFFGGEEDLATGKKITPGFYSGGYAHIENAEGLESEFILNANGDFWLFWITENQPWYDLRGKWGQKNSELIFSEMEEIWGAFTTWLPVEDDTNAVAKVTAKSFSRKEWTPLRQKPYWIKYQRKSVLELGDGVYQSISAFPGDSTDTVVAKTTTPCGAVIFSTPTPRTLWNCSRQRPSGTNSARCWRRRRISRGDTTFRIR